jgi:ferredoxin-NADP reductase
VKLNSRREVAEKTVAFYFEKPSNFLFQAGQFIDLILPDQQNGQAEEKQRTFTIASAPTEDDLMVATRMRDSSFKRQLMDTPIGSSMQMEGPFGNLTLPENPPQPIVLIAGGIGITPFRSMVVHAAAKNLPHRFWLFYANRHPEDAPFLEELQEMEKHNSTYTFIGTMTKLAESKIPWSGPTGYVDRAMLERYLSDLESPLYYIVGPPEMVWGVTDMLDSAGVQKVNIKTEEFFGY